LIHHHRCSPMKLPGAREIAASRRVAVGGGGCRPRARRVAPSRPPMSAAIAAARWVRHAATCLQFPRIAAEEIPTLPALRKPSNRRAGWPISDHDPAARANDGYLQWPGAPRGHLRSARPGPSAEAWNGAPGAAPARAPRREFAGLLLALAAPAPRRARRSGLTDPAVYKELV